MIAEPITWTTTHGDQVTIWRSSDYNDDARMRWYYRVRARNGRIVEHGQGYTRCTNAVHAALRHHPRIVDGEPRYELWSS